jgi:hypothetical protein
MEIYDIFETDFASRQDSEEQQKEHKSLRRRLLDEDSSDLQAQYLRGKQGHRRLLEDENLGPSLEMNELLDSDTSTLLVGNSNRFDVAHWSLAMLAIVLVVFAAYKKRSTMKRNNGSDYAYDGLHLSQTDLNHLSDDWGTD